MKKKQAGGEQEEEGQEGKEGCERFLPPILKAGKMDRTWKAGGRKWKERKGGEAMEDEKE